ncbi:hypothetical protein BG60_22685 [Caballeronia zhejiangensis]|uniref:Uncharacterized protein n=1 Tax=Caballeronia zhejiangensis TaxID=871203 RepID=A0A656QAL1_9BURK|nr:hypothetical protein BG60_22685 [Caballeronia zhejiangensis]
MQQYFELTVTRNLLDGIRQMRQQPFHYLFLPTFANRRVHASDLQRLLRIDRRRRLKTKHSSSKILLRCQHHAVD